MKRAQTLLYIILCMVLVAVSTHAAFPTDGLYVYYNHDETSGTTLFDTVRGLNGTLTNTPTLGLPGIHNTAINYTQGSDSYANVDAALAKSYSNFTFSDWVHGDNQLATTHYLFGQNTASNDIFCFKKDTAQVQCRFNNGGGNQDITSSMTINGNAWYHIMYLYDGDSCILFINDVYQGRNTGCSGSATLTAFNIGLVAGESLESDARHDEFAYWARNLTRAEVTETNSTFFTPGGPNIGISTTSPPDESGFSTSQVSFQVNITTATANWTAALYINDTLNHTSTTLLNTTTRYDTNVTFADGNYTYHWLAYLTGTPTTNATSNNLSFFVDTVQPTIMPTTPDTGSGGEYPNNVFYQNFTTNINVYDENLYAWYINITDPTGTLVYNVSNTSLAGATNVTITQFIDVSSLSGYYDFNITAADGHTKRSIPSLKPRIENKELEFSRGGTVTINDVNKQNIDYLWETKWTDRHVFGYEYTTSVTQATYRVRSSEYIDILNGRTKYKGHLVMGDKWVDFENEHVEHVSVERISRTEVLVHITYDTRMKTVQFNSVGQINYNTVSMPIFVPTTTQHAASSVQSGETTSFQLNVTYNPIFNTSSTAVTALLDYNNQNRTPTVTSNSTHYTFDSTFTAPVVTTDTNISYYWNFKHGTPWYKTPATLQTVQHVDIDSCTTYSTAWLNISVKDENTDVGLNTSASYIINFTNNPSQSGLNGSQTLVPSYQFCLTPADANFSTDIHFQYGASGYVTRDYITYGFPADNNTDFVTLYLLDNTNSTSINLHVVDGSDNDLSGILIEAYKWDIANNIDILVETQLTDTQGNAQFNLQTGSTYYSFKFYQNTILALSTERFKLFATEYEYRITSTGTSPLAEYLQLKGTAKLTNVSNTINYNWTSHPLASQYCMKVTGNNTVFYNACGLGSINSSLSFNATVLNITYLAIGTVNATSGNEYILDTLSLDLTQSIRKIIGDALAIFIVMVLYLFFTLLVLPYNKSAPVAIVIPVSFSLFLLGLLPGGLTSFIGITSIALFILWVINK